MEQLSNIGVIRDVLSRHGFTFSKSLGQNFLINPAVCPRMAELGGAGPGVGMLEIGDNIKEVFYMTRRDKANYYLDIAETVAERGTCLCRPDKGWLQAYPRGKRG